MSNNHKNATAFLTSIEKMCRKRTLQVCKYQDHMKSLLDDLPADVEGHMTSVFEALKELSRYVYHEPNLSAHDYYEYMLISQLLVLSWKSTVYIADIVAHLQRQILCSGTWLSKRPKSPAVLPTCLQGYRLYCRIAEECIDFLRSGMMMQVSARHHNESMLMLMNTKVDAERETLEDWLKTLHNDMSSTVTSIEKKLTLLSFPAPWE